MKQIELDSSLKKLSIDALIVQTGRFVLSFYGESLGGRGFVMVYLRSRYKHRWIELAESYLLILEHRYSTGNIPRKNR